MEQDEAATPSRPDDTALWEAAAAGDSAAFGSLFSRHSKAVYNHCFRRLGSWGTAEDATSLVFLEAWRRRRHVTPVNGSVLPWLLGTATNVCRNTKRAARRYEAGLFRLPAPAPEPDPSEDIAERLDDEVRARALMQALAGLNRGQREVVELVVLSGLSYAEAAVALGVPVGTVRSRLGRSRKFLERAAEFSAGHQPAAHRAATFGFEAGK
jgi:RNA polymerase sigma-70 factor (ECF subfamily)